MSNDNDEFNEAELAAGRIRPAHVSELTARFQAANGLVADGKLGPQTRAMVELLRGRQPGDAPRAGTGVPVMKRETVMLLPEVKISDAGWLSGAGVTVMPIHASWYYKHLATVTGKPMAIVAHYSGTPHGTADNMARNRAAKIDLDPNDGDGVDRQASWHVSVEGDGTILQMAPLLVGCWHAGGKTAKPIPGVGPANRTSIGIELIGDGSAFPEAQVTGATRLWRAIVQAYGIERANAMITHQQLDPTRKKDPGPVWMGQHAPGVLEYAFRA